MIHNDVRVKKYFVPNLMSPIASNSRKESHYEKNENIQTTKILYRNFSLHRILAYMPLPEKFIPTPAANLNS